jgi:hypothetical protein
MPASHDQAYRAIFQRPDAHAPQDASPAPPDDPETVDAVIEAAETGLESIAALEASREEARQAQIEAGRAGGKLGGRPKKGSRQAVARLCQRMVSDPAYQKQLVERLRSGRLSPVMESALWAYAYGRPVESIDVQAKVAAVVSVVKPW